MIHSVGDSWLWSLFAVTVSAALLVDLGLLLRGSHQTAMLLRETLLRCFGWTILALVFNAVVWGYLDWRDGSAVATQKGLEFFTAYLLEKSLSVDNLFVMLIIFQSFRIPPLLQRRVLFWGVLGAIVLRFVIIFSGTWLVGRFHWILYLFGVFMVWSGIRMLIAKEEIEDPSKNPMLLWLSRHMRITHELQGEYFFIRRGGVLWATPLFFVLVSVEISDVIFATDSIPAVFAITLDSFIVFASNIFAILGLRALYFLLVLAHEKIDSLQIGIALVLMLTGLKMLAEHWIKVPVDWMLGLIVMILLVTGIGGWVKKRKG